MIVIGSYLLFGLVACTRPFCDNVFFRLGIGRKGKGDAGKGGALKGVR